MKKSLIALAVLSSFVGAASAASSVTLYGYVDVGYEDWTGKGTTGSGPDVKAATSGKLQQGGSSESNSSFGIKGEEDLGNGMTAIFKLEGRFDASEGKNQENFFQRESTVGLKGAFGQVKFGHAKSQIEQALGGAAPGARVADLDLYSVVATRHSNGLFYSYDNNGMEFGADITTKGGATGNTENASGGRLGWGVRLGYSGELAGTELTVRAAHQDDGGTTTSRESGVLVSAGFGKVTVGAAYAKGRGEAYDFLAYKSFNSPAAYAKTATTASVFVSGALTDNDSVYLKYQQRKAKAESGASLYKTGVMAAGYSHSLSPRTSLYADVAYARINTAYDSISNTGIAGNGKAIGYSFAVSHAF